MQVGGFSKSSGGGLGGGPKKLGETTVATYPDGFVEGSLGWGNLSRKIINPLAISWFGEYPTGKISDSLRPGALEYKEPLIDRFASFYFGEDEFSMIKDLTKNLSDFGEEVDVEDSELGRALLNLLKNAGINWRYQTRVAISPFEAVDLPDLKVEGIADWNSYFDMPVIQRFKIYRNSAGEETCVWLTPALAATRPFEHITEREYLDADGNVQVAVIPQAELDKGALTFGEWSTEIFLPVLATGLFYLAETPFPSSFLGLSRAMAYGDMAEQDRPRPFILNERHQDIVGVFGEQNGQYLTTATMLPNVVSLGWSFTSKDPDTLLKIIEKVSTGLVRIASFLEDGYLNYYEDGTFDNTVLSANTFSQTQVGKSWADALSRWIPAARIGLFLNEFNNLASEAFEADRSGDSPSAREMFEAISFDGAGMFLPNCINTLVFSWLISEKEWDLIDRLLDTAWRLNYGRESFNALSNWGVAKYHQGKLEEAIEKFTSALADPGGDTEAEACHYLSRIYRDLGDEAKSLEFQARCDAAGGYSSVPGAQDSQASDTPFSKASSQGFGATESSESLPKFCSNCGNKFEIGAAKFCGNCGTAR